MAIIGSSGSGKSTVLRCINRLIEPTEGEIYLKDEQINTPHANINEVRSRIGMVFQSFELFPHLKVIDNITLGLIQVRGMAKAEAEKWALEVLERVDMLDRKDAYPGNLSGGQKQRVAIARALSANPKLLLADEPTSALDSVTGREIVTLLRKLAKEQNCSVLMVTHDPRISDMADRILNMEDGKIYSAHSELI